MSAVIEIDGLNYHVAKKDILREIRLSVNEGEYVSIIGPNGAGKTTLLRCIDRIVPAGIDFIKIYGKPLHLLSQKQIASSVGYVPQIDGRDFPFTVSEFVMMGRYPHLSPFSSIRREDRYAVNRVMEITGIVEFADRFLGTLSSGERQRVFIAAALAQDAKILLLDEATTFLDYRHRSEVRSLLRKLNRNSGVTILSVTHDINSAAMSSDRIIAIKDGVIVFIGAPVELMKQNILEKIYEMSFILAPHPATGQYLIMPEEVAT